MWSFCPASLTWYIFQAYLFYRVHEYIIPFLWQFITTCKGLERERVPLFSLKGCSVAHVPHQLGARDLVQAAQAEPGWVFYVAGAQATEPLCQMLPPRLCVGGSGVGSGAGTTWVCQVTRQTCPSLSPVSSAVTARPSVCPSVRVSITEWA